MTEVRINVIKIDRSGIYVGEKGKYLTLALIKNKGGKDKYGYDGFVAQELSKERREAGERGAIVGNWRNTEPNQSSEQNKGAADWGDDDDIPF